MIRVLYFSSFIKHQKQNRKSCFENIWILRFHFSILGAWKIAILKKCYSLMANINHLLTSNMAQYHTSLHLLQFLHYKKRMSLGKDSKFLASSATMNKLYRQYNLLRTLCYLTACTIWSATAKIPLKFSEINWNFIFKLHPFLPECFHQSWYFGWFLHQGICVLWSILFI